MNTFIISLSLLVLILVSAYFLFSNYSEALEKASEDGADSNTKSAVEDIKTSSVGKSSKVKPVKKVKTKSSPKKEEKPKSKTIEKVSPKPAPVETPKVKRGRKKKS